MTGLPFDQSRHQLLRTMLAVWGVVGLFAATPLFAQPAPPLPQPRVDEETVSPNAEAADSNTATSEAAGEPDVRWLHIPAAELDRVFNERRPGVLLPRDEFRKLWHAAKAAEEQRPRQPAGAVVSAADYTAHVEGEHLRIAAEIRFTQFASGWCVLRIPVGGLHVEAASIDGHAAPVARDPQQPDTLLLFSRAQGPQQLMLELSAPVRPVGSDGEVEFTLPGAPSGTLRLSPPAGKTVLVDGLAIPASAGGNGEALYEIPLGGRSQISLRLTDGEATQAADPLLMATTAYHLHAAPGEVTWATHTSLTRSGPPLDVLTLTVPSLLDVAGVTSEGLASWDITEAEDADREKITLTYRQPFTGTRGVSIHGVFVPEGEEWTVPTLSLVGADSHIGSVVVQPDPGIRLQPAYGESVRPAPAGELSHTPADMAVTHADTAVEPMGFRWTREDFELSFFTPRKEGVIMAAMTNLLHISDDGLDLATAIDVQAAVAPLFEIQLTLPADFELTALAVAGQATDWTEGTSEVGMNDIRITLATPLQPGESRRVDFAAHADPEDWPVQGDPVLLSLPPVGLPQADMLEAQYGITAHDDLELEIIEVSGLAAARGEDAAALQRLAQSSGRQLRLGFIHQDTEFSTEFEVRRRPVTFSVSSTLVSRLEPERAVTQLHATVTVEAGGLEGLLIQLPESVTPDARFRVVSEQTGRPPATNARGDDAHIPAIVEQTVSEGQGGLRTWALKFDQRVRGTHELAAVLTQPRGEEAAVTLPTPTFVGADRQNGWIAVEARDDQRLEVTAVDAVGQPLQDVDPIDLPGRAVRDSSQRRIVAGYHYARPGATATVSEEQFERSAVPSAVADRFELESVIGPAGEWQHRLHVALRAVGVQSLLLALPADAELWGVMLDRQPVEVRRSPQGYQVPLRSAAAASDTRTLQLFYRTRAAELDAAGRLQQAAPQLAIRHGSGQLQPIDVLARDWTLFYPRDIVLLASRGTLSPTERLQLDTLANRLWDALRVPSIESGVGRIGIAAAVLVFVWLMSKLRYATSWTWPLIAAVALAGLLIFAFLVVLFATRGRMASDGAATSTAAVEDASEPAGVPGQRTMRGFAAGDRFDAEDAEKAAGRRQAGEAETPPRASESSVPSAPDRQQAPAPQAPMTPPSDAAAEESRFDRDADGGMPDRGAQPADEALGLPVQQAAEALGRRGALLSLSLDMEAPREYRRTVFRSVGTAADPETAAVDVRYASRSFRQVTALIAALGVLLVMWWMRAANGVLRGVLVVLTIILPLALLTIIPPLGAMIVEGVLLGGVAGVMLWGVRALMGTIQRWSDQSNAKAANSQSPANQVVVGLILLASMWAAPGSTHAEDSAARKSFPSQSRERQRPVADAAGGMATVIVPYSDGDPFAADRVLLSRELFEALRSQADPEAALIGPPPLEGVVAEANYTVEVGDLAADSSGESSLRVVGRFVLHSFRDRPVSVRLPIRRVAVVSASLDERPAVVRPTENEGLAAIVQEPGRHVLEVGFQLPAKRQANAGEFVLSLLPVAAGRLMVTLPAREDWAVSVQGDDRTPLGYRRQTENGGVVVEVPIDRGGDVTVSWQPEQTIDGRREIVNVESTTAVQLDDRGVQLHAAYDVQVRQGALSRLVFSVPEHLRLKRLSGPDVGGWQLDDGGSEGDNSNAERDSNDARGSNGGERTLTVFLRRSVNDETHITAELFLAESGTGNETSFEVPSPAPRDITREAGEIVLLADDLREVRIDAAEALVRTGTLTGELPRELNPQSLPVRGVFRFSSRPWRLSVGASVRAQETRVTAEHGMFVGRRKILLGSRLQFDLSGAPRRRLRVLLPHDFLLFDLHAADVAEWFVEGGELVLDLGKPRMGRVVVTFEGQIPRFEDDAEAVLETPLPTDVQRQDSRLAIWIEDELSATLAQFVGWRPLAPDELSPELRSLHSQPVQFAFRSSEVEPELVILQMDTAQPRLVCDAITLIAASDTSVDYGLTLRWTIERAATDRLIFTTPDWLDERLRFTSEGIRRTASEILDDGRVRWTVSLDQAVRGQFLVSAVATLPPPANGLIAAPAIRFEEPAGASDEFVEVSVQETYAVLVNLSGTQITAVAEETHEEVRAGDLPFKLRDELLAQAMQVVRIRGGEGVSWRMQPVVEQQAATATVTAADLTTILAADGSWRTQAEYRVRNRGHQFLAVRLPAGARLLSVLVKDQPTRAQQTELEGEAVALVPLPQTSAADLSFEIALVLQGALPRPLSRVWSINGEQVAIPVPTVVSPQESAEYGVPVVHTRWSVSVPEEFRASPVMEEGLTNVTQVSEGAGGVMPYLQQLKELADLNRLVQDSSLSYTQRKRAAENLRQLGAKLQQPSDQYGLPELMGKSSTNIPVELKELAQQQERLLSESLRNAAELEGVLSKEEAGGMLVADPQRDSQRYIEGNTAMIFRDNAGAGIALPAPQDEARFGFDSPKAADMKAIDRGGPTSENQPQQSRSLLRERLSRQELLFEQAPQQMPQEAQAQSINGITQQFSSPEATPMQPFPQRGRMGGGGGMGGGAFNDFSFGAFGGEVAPPLTAAFSEMDAAAGQTAGLSLPIEIPVEGHTLEFSKLGGDPQLTLAIQTRESITLGLRWLWTVVWIGVGVAVLWILLARARPMNWRPPAAIACLVLGIVALALLPWPSAWLGPLLLVMSGVIWLTSPASGAASTIAPAA